MMATERVQVELVRQHLSGLFNHPGDMLYVGANPIRCHLANEFNDTGWHLELLEIWSPNIDHYSNGGPFHDLKLGDIREVDGLTHDALFWWHGPEHISKDEIPVVLERLEGMVSAIVLGCPWGKYRQGAEYGNPYEEHKATLYPVDFLDWGYEVATCGMADTGDGLSHILAWKNVYKRSE
jgi:hypothetical protein